MLRVRHAHAADDELALRTVACGDGRSGNNDRTVLGGVHGQVRGDLFPLVRLRLRAGGICGLRGHRGGSLIRIGSAAAEPIEQSHSLTPFRNFGAFCSIAYNSWL